MIKMFSFKINKNTASLFRNLKVWFAGRLFSRQDANRYYVKADNLRTQKELMNCLNIKPK